MSTEIAVNENNLETQQFIFKQVCYDTPTMLELMWTFRIRYALHNVYLLIVLSLKPHNTKKCLKPFVFKNAKDNYIYKNVVSTFFN